MSQTIVVGGGLSGLSAAHTIIEGGGRVCLIDKNTFMGGNSTKATSGMNGAATRTQAALGIKDSIEAFEEDTIRGATGVKDRSIPCPPKYPLGTVLTHNSTDAVHWIQDSFGLALDVCGRLGGHSYQRTHRSSKGGKFPGMEITYALMQKFDALCESSPDRVKYIGKGNVDKLLTDASGAITGIEYTKKGQRHSESANAVVIATGGYGAGGLFKNSLLQKTRPELCHLPTTNGEHCTGDGIMMAQAIGGGAVDLDRVQVHPTGLVNPEDPDNRTKFLAAEALRGEGGILVDREGRRFCDDLGTRDYVTACMIKHDKAPYYLVLNQNASSGIAWHCKHYVGRGVMKTYASGAEFAKSTNIDPSVLQSTFQGYNQSAKSNKDHFGLRFFKAAPIDLRDSFHVAIVTPTVHYTMGGLLINTDANVLKAGSTQPINGLYAAGEATGGVHLNNRLGGSALLECVVFGRVAGHSVLKYVAANPNAGGAAAAADGGSTVTISIPQPNGQPIVVTVTGAGFTGTTATAAPAAAAAAAPATAAAAPAAEETATQGEYTMAEVAKHKTDEDCWVVVNGQVLDVTPFLSDHPGGKMAIMTFAGKDASEEFNMVHDANVIEKYASEYIVGTVKPTSKL